MIPLDSLKNIKESLEINIEVLIQNGYIYFGASDTLGFDTIAKLTVLQLRKKYPQIKLILVLYCKTHTRA